MDETCETVFFVALKNAWEKVFLNFNEVGLVGEDCYFRHFEFWFLKL